MIVRAARDDDAGALIALIKPIFEEYEGVQFSIDEMPELTAIATSFAAAGGSFWCVERDERLIGCAGWTPSSGGVGAELKKLYVAADARRGGIASMLTQQIEQSACAGGASFVELWSDTRFEAAHRFYERHGYTRGKRTRKLDDLSRSTEFYFRKSLGCA